ncbi:MAG: 4-hydroxy-tetrahydrodipicolinate synthase [Spirochaetales bacterium]|nr:4-hydroxy-tetrahydrodipicolinate synthase [Spirochaetales bacterium]
MYRGVYTALVTPFKSDGSVDEVALRNLVDAQIAGGVQGIVPVGTTGESPTVTHKENIQIVGIVIDQAAGRVPVIAGTGSNNTQEAIDMTTQAKELGAAASLQVAPYYNKPNQEGLYLHFWTLAEKVDLPLIVYNIPGRSSVNIETSTLMELANHRNIVGVKEASGNISQMMDVLSQRPANFSVLSGDDNLVFPLIALGGDGVISVASNIIPGEMSQFVNTCLDGKWDEARCQHYALLPLFRAMFFDTNPLPIKYALSLTGVMEAHYRLPMIVPKEEIRQKIHQVLIDQGIL